VAGALIITAALALALWAISQQEHVVVHTLSKIGLATVLVSTLFGVLATAVLLPLWRSTLRALDVNLPTGVAARVFYVSQLGKYVPGSVWPVLLQMEAGRKAGASRRTMLVANMITLALSCAVGLILALVLLPFANGAALTRYWWVLLALPPCYCCCIPELFPDYSTPFSPEWAENPSNSE
jgi:uncharacterized membrane protein YbhN (UPF0104 family)